MIPDPTITHFDLRFAVRGAQAVVCCLFFLVRSSFAWSASAERSSLDLDPRD